MAFQIEVAESLSYGWQEKRWILSVLDDDCVLRHSPDGEPLQHQTRLNTASNTVSASPGVSREACFATGLKPTWRDSCIL